MKISVLIIVLLTLLCTSFKTSETEEKHINGPTAGQIVAKIKNEVTCEWMNETVDTYKAGNKNMQVTGITTTFIATLDVLKKAKSMGCNMIITHEPTYYNHLDEIADLKEDEVLLNKKRFIEENNLVIWRFHDHWHRTQPDGIYKGMAREMKLEDKLVKGEDRIFSIKETTLREYVQHLKSIYPTSNMRIIGNPDMKFTNLGFAAGAPGSKMQIDLLQRDDVSVLLAGESHEWETVEYVRDAVAAGKHKACILMGHAISEEGGMQYCAAWLKQFVDEVPVHFIAAGDPFWSP